MGTPRFRSDQLNPTVSRAPVPTISLPTSKPCPANEASRATVDTPTPTDSDTLMSAVSGYMVGEGQSFQFRPPRTNQSLSWREMGLRSHYTSYSKDDLPGPSSQTFHDTTIIALPTARTYKPWTACPRLTGKRCPSATVGWCRQMPSGIRARGRMRRKSSL